MVRHWNRSVWSYQDFTLFLFKQLSGMSYVQHSCFGAEEIKVLPSIICYGTYEMETDTDATGPTDPFTGCLPDQGPA